MKNKQNQKTKNCGNKNCGVKDCAEKKKQNNDHGYDHGGNN